jgi:hypothetical protein
MASAARPIAGLFSFTPRPRRFLRAGEISADHRFIRRFLCDETDSSPKEKLRIAGLCAESLIGERRVGWSGFAA